MRPRTLKISVSVALIVLIAGSLPFVGLTERPVDDRQGVVIDFGYWDASWTEMSFSAGQNALDVLESACERKGYSKPVYLPDGSVYSIDGQTNLPNAEWLPGKQIRQGIGAPFISHNFRCHRLTCTFSPG